ncbi:McrC family protein [Helicobacter sp. 13S00477-4]|uniref:McrC family protein n=1 Tax=Helicobacter sp. 13S00477-4 TaxID=1905759 RepID=UPI000BCCB7D2|nr:McrC family protein [Helicobacter sp. 13S00477-4]PAF52330.1 hypothetical protein BKH44_03215 [Helicobacter sp. 13S00477-4]
MNGKKQKFINLLKPKKMINKNTLEIIEWDEFDEYKILEILKDKQKTSLEDKQKASKVFEELKKFASYEENNQFLKLTKGGRCLKSCNFVGLIQTKSGFSLEILPKTSDRNEDKMKAKQLLEKMLKTLKNFPFKTINFSSIKTTQNSLLEIFVKMFLDELSVVIKKGIKSDYISIEENRFYLKGKVLFSNQIRQNLINQQRFYTNADEYISDIPQNRLIVSVLKLFSKIPLSNKIQSLLNQYFFIFDGIGASRNADKDFNLCVKSHSLKHYEIILSWCKVFLKKEIFTPYAGDSVGLALLFDMNKLFESFVAYCFKKYSQGWEISLQDKGKYLCKNNYKDIFALKPDIVAKQKADKIMILDTKWKKITSQKDINQADIYQIWSYVSKYKKICDNVMAVLIYPAFLENCSVESPFVFKADEKSKLHIVYIDLNKLIDDKKASNEIKRIMDKFQI